MFLASNLMILIFCKIFTSVNDSILKIDKTLQNAGSNKRSESHLGHTLNFGLNFMIFCLKIMFQNKSLTPSSTMI